MKKFIWCNKDSQSFFDTELFMCSFEDEIDLPTIPRETQKSETNLYRERANYYGTKYSTQLQIPIGFVKIDKGSFTIRDRELIEDWLYECDTPSDLIIEDFNGKQSIFNGVFVGITWKAFGYSVIGASATFECATPYWYTECEETEDFIDNGTWDILCDTSSKYIYPNIEITNGDEFISITNKTDNNEEFSFNTKKEIYSRKSLSFDIDSSNEYTTFPDGEHVSGLTNHLYSDISLNLSYITYWNETNYALWKDSSTETIYSGAIDGYWDNGVGIYTPKEKWVRVITGDDLNVMWVKLDENSLSELLKNKQVDVYSGYYKFTIFLNSYDISLSEKSGGASFNCEYCKVTSSQSYSDLGWENKEHIYWLRFLKGMNSLSINGSCSIKIKFRTAKRGLGSYFGDFATNRTFVSFSDERMFVDGFYGLQGEHLIVEGTYDADGMII